MQAQDQEPYNDDLPFRIISAETELPANDSIKALLIHFGGSSVGNLEKTVRNNPQLVEIQLIRAPQSAIDLLSDIRPPALKYLLIEEYSGKTMHIGAFPTVGTLWIESETTTELSMENAELPALAVMSLDVPKLTTWKAAAQWPVIELIDLTAPELHTFPIQSAPKLFQLSYYCSFDELPAFLCSCPELEHISFENYKRIEVPECMKEKVKKAYHSNITIYDKPDGNVVLEILSKRR